jgi:hypothetical protein
MQVFKGDSTELKVSESESQLHSFIKMGLDELFTNAYVVKALGRVIFDLNAAPLTNAIAREIFAACFPELFASFQVAGSFESYISVFKKIFGEDVDISFTIPAAGKLQIDIVAAEVEESNFVARRIDSETYVFDNVVERDTGDQIIFQTEKGFVGQYELAQMLTQLVPGGVYPVITLNLS